MPLWAGRTSALLGIVLVAFSLRRAVAAISPRIGDIRLDIPITSLGVGLLGTLPPILFAVSGFVAPRVAHGIGLDGGIVLALVLITTGHAVPAALAAPLAEQSGSTLGFRRHRIAAGRSRHATVAVAHGAVDHRPVLDQHDLHLRGFRLAARDPRRHRRFEAHRGRGCCSP